MSAMRDERAEVFEYADIGSDGRAAPSYSRTGTYWTRRGVPSAREGTTAGQASQSVDAVFEFAGGIEIPADGALRHQDGTYYKVVGVKLVRGTASEKVQVVEAVYADEQVLALVDTDFLEDESDDFIVIE